MDETELIEKFSLICSKQQRNAKSLLTKIEIRLRINWSILSSYIVRHIPIWYLRTSLSVIQINLSTDMGMNPESLHPTRTEFRRKHYTYTCFPISLNAGAPYQFEPNNNKRMFDVWSKKMIDVATQQALDGRSGAA